MTFLTALKVGVGLAIGYAAIPIVIVLAIALVVGLFLATLVAFEKIGMAWSWAKKKVGNKQWQA